VLVITTCRALDSQDTRVVTYSFGAPLWRQARFCWAQVRAKKWASSATQPLSIPGSLTSYIPRQYYAVQQTRWSRHQIPKWQNSIISIQRLYSELYWKRQQLSAAWNCYTLIKHVYTHKVYTIKMCLVKTLHMAYNKFRLYTFWNLQPAEPPCGFQYLE